MAMDREAVVEKVQKLLNLANGTDVEGEMNLALQRAHELLAKYDLSMSDVELKEDIGEMVTEEAASFTRTYQWIWEITKAIDKLCNTRHLRFGRGWRFSMHFCGTKTDVASARAMFQFLYTTLQKMGKDARLPGIRERNSYLNGVGRRVYRRAVEMTRVKEDPTKTTAIVHVKGEAVQKYMKETWVVKEAKPTTVTSSQWAYSMGLKDGDKVPLQTNATPIETKKVLSK